MLLTLSIVRCFFFSAAVITDDEEVGLGMVADGTPCGTGKVCTHIGSLHV